MIIEFLEDTPPYKKGDILYNCSYNPSYDCYTDYDKGYFISPHVCREIKMKEAFEVEKYKIIKDIPCCGNKTKELKYLRQDYHDFLELEADSCQCSTSNPPCSWCMHPGNNIEDQLSDLGLTEGQIQMFLDDKDIELLLGGAKLDWERKDFRQTVIANMGLEQKNVKYCCIKLDAYVPLINPCNCGAKFDTAGKLRQHLIEKGLGHMSATMLELFKKEI